MSARAPFIPRPASRIDAPAADKPTSPSPSAGYESFRSNGLLPPPPNAQSAGERPPHNDPDANFKPLNLSGLSKVKNGSPMVARLNNISRSSVDGSGLAARSPKPFAPAHQNQKHLAAPRPTSPFFPNAGLVSMNAFRQQPPSSQQSKDDLSSNKAHIVSSAVDSDLGLADHHHNLSIPARPPSPESFRFLDPPSSLAAHHRARTTSHPSLESIREVEEEVDHSSPHKISMGPPGLGSEDDDNYAGDFTGGFVDPSHSHSHGDPQYPQGLRRTTKRLERSADEESDFGYAPGAKRYKMSAQEDDYAMAFGGRVTPAPARYSNGEFERTATPAQGFPPLLVSHGSRKVPGDDGPKQGLYRLLGQDLDICVEAHEDVYEQAKRKWSECSMEEWTKGADDLATRFAKMLDIVKDHMTAKLALYASLHNTISEHRSVLSEQEQTLSEAKENLLREAGSVVGGPSKATTGEEIEN